MKERQNPQLDSKVLVVKRFVYSLNKDKTFTGIITNINKDKSIITCLVKDEKKEIKFKKNNEGYYNTGSSLAYYIMYPDKKIYEDEVLHLELSKKLSNIPMKFLTELSIEELKEINSKIFKK